MKTTTHLPILQIFLFITKAIKALTPYAVGLLAGSSAVAFQYQPESAGGEKNIDLNRIEKVADSLATGYTANNDVPGLNVAVAKDGKILFLKSYGKADLEMNAAVTPETIFGIASVTKQYTAAAIMRLVEQGKISTEDPITKFLPDYPVRGRHVTIHHLLSHTSGLKDYRLKNEKMPDWYKVPMTYEEMVALWGNEPFDFEPGEKYDYNNWGYFLLGQILQRVTGKDWLEYAEPELLRPLGLEKTMFSRPELIIPGRAEGYLHQKENLINLPYRDISLFNAGGGLSSTIQDLLKWTNLLHSGKVVSKESVQKMTEPVTLNSGDTIGYGYGLYVNEHRGHRKIYHGGTFGFGAYVSHYPEKGISIAILTNSSKGRARGEEMEELLANVALDIKISDIPLASEDIKRYEGVYKYQSTPTIVRELKIFGESGRLMAQIGNGRAIPLRYQGEHKFIPDSRGITAIIFEVENNLANNLKIHEGAWEITLGVRKENQEIRD